MIQNLAHAIGILKESLLILVDEYDQPVREALLQFAPRHCRSLYEEAKRELKTVFTHYVSFFRAVKPVLREMSACI
jgi:hypothetical protein